MFTMFQFAETPEKEVVFGGNPTPYHSVLSKYRITSLLVGKSSIYRSLFFFLVPKFKKVVFEEELKPKMP